VCFRSGKAPTRRNLGAASLFSFVMVAEVSSIITFRTRTNSSGVIEYEELSFREWNCFEHFGTSAGRKPYFCALVEMAQRWESGAGRKPHICTAQPGRLHPMHRGSRGAEKPLNLCLLFEAYCTARLLQELDQVALDFTLTRLCWPPSAALGLAIDGPELGRHRRSLAAVGARPPSAEAAELGRHLRHSAAIGGA
jgi:hypothetical protein